MMSQRRALVLFSGGQDSATCLAWALSRYAHVETLGFDYGQRHRVELECRSHLRAGLLGLQAQWPGRLGDDHLLTVDVLGQLGASAMTDDVAITMQADGLPNTFVPGRNLLFFTLAAALAYRRGLDVLVGGMSQTDYSGYPDCRPAFIEAFETMANLATKAGVEGHRLTIHAPLIDLSKAQIIQRGTELGVDYGLTVSCYQADDQGRACGVCDSCRLRREGFEAAGIPDPTRYR